MLSDETKRDAIERLRLAATKLEEGDEKAAGFALLHGLRAVAVDLRKTYGPVVKIVVNSWVRQIFEETK